MTIGHFLGWYLVTWLTGLAIIVLFQMATGQITLVGVLSTETEKVSPERIPLLLTTIYGLTWFAAATLAAHKFPEVSETFVAIFAASHLTYLGGKTFGR